MATYRGRCAKCGGGVYLEEGVIKCYQCSLEVDTPERRREWFRLNLDDMCRDLIAHGTKEFLKHWPVSSQMVSHIKSSRNYHKLGGAEPVRHEARTREIPNLPPWSEAWGDNVKVAWLELVHSVVKKAKQEVLVFESHNKSQ